MAGQVPTHSIRKSFLACFLILSLYFLFFSTNTQVLFLLAIGYIFFIVWLTFFDEQGDDMEWAESLQLRPDGRTTLGEAFRLARVRMRLRCRRLLWVEDYRR